MIYAGGVAARVHASLAVSRSRRLAQQIAQSTIDIGMNGMRGLEVRQGDDVPLLLECLYHVNPLRYACFT